MPNSNLRMSLFWLTVPEGKELAVGKNHGSRQGMVTRTGSQEIKQAESTLEVGEMMSPQSLPIVPCCLPQVTVCSAVPQMEDRKFQCQSLWGMFLIKPPLSLRKVEEVGVGLSNL